MCFFLFVSPDSWQAIGVLTSHRWIFGGKLFSQGAVQGTGQGAVQGAATFAKGAV